MSLLPKKFDILILYICTINGCQNYLVCSKRIETLISECLCIFIGRIQVIFIGLWPGTQSRIGTTFSVSAWLSSRGSTQFSICKSRAIWWCTGMFSRPGRVKIGNVPPFQLTSVPLVENPVEFVTKSMVFVTKSLVLDGD